MQLKSVVLSWDLKAARLLDNCTLLGKRQQVVGSTSDQCCDLAWAARCRRAWVDVWKAT